MPSCLHLIATPKVAVGVFAVRDVERVDPAVEPGPAHTLARSGELTADLAAPSLPIFFDFEGAWTRVIGAVAPISYPRALPRSSENRSAPLSPRVERLRAEAEEMVRRPFARSVAADSGRHLGSLFGFGRASAALNVGRVQRRAFLNLARCPRWGGWRLERVSFIHGMLRPDVTAEGLYFRLLSQGRMTPFLFATDRQSVLLGALAPSPRAVASGNRERISIVLKESLVGFASLAMESSQLEVLVDHRYDRLLDQRG